MHKKYIEPSIPICADYIPEDLILCSRCTYFKICPFDYKCNTLERVNEYEILVNDNTDERVE